MQTDKDLEQLPETGASRPLPADRRARAKAAEQAKRDPTPQEQEAERRYWNENKGLFQG